MANIKVNEFDTAKEAAWECAKYIHNSLSENSHTENLFIASGGSSIAVTAELTTFLDLNITNSTILTISDERFGPVGHDDSNWKKMLDKGVDVDLFKSCIEPLNGEDTAKESAENFSQNIEKTLKDTDFNICLLGIGEDSHIAGMLPDEADKFDEKFLGDFYASSHQAYDFPRITITPKTLKKMDEIVLFAAGPNKNEPILDLQSSLPLNEYPSQILREMRRVTVFYGKAEQ